MAGHTVTRIDNYLFETGHPVSLQTASMLAREDMLLTPIVRRGVNINNS